jgi:TPP-dependent 2-oxoacid decarboxylase
MTIQELSTLLHEGCAPLLVVLNNGQYVVEDLAVGQQMQANKIWVWDYCALAAGFDDHRAHQPLALRVSYRRRAGRRVRAGTPTPIRSPIPRSMSRSVDPTPYRGIPALA